LVGPRREERRYTMESMRERGVGGREGLGRGVGEREGGGEV
jgi:hypothetical protein